METEMVMMTEEDYNELIFDMSYLEATIDLLTAKLIESGIEVVISEDEILERIREEETGDSALN